MPPYYIVLDACLLRRHRPFVGARPSGRQWRQCQNPIAERARLLRQAGIIIGIIPRFSLQHDTDWMCHRIMLRLMPVYPAAARPFVGAHPFVGARPSGRHPGHRATSSHNRREGSAPTNIPSTLARCVLEVISASLILITLGFVNV